MVNGKEAFMHFKSSWKKLSNTRWLALIASFIALKIGMSFFSIPVGENLYFSMTFLVVALEAMLIGPAAGMVSGAVTDLIGYFINPMGPWFPGYTLTAMLGEFVYGCFFYEKEIRWRHIIGAKIITSYGVNVLLGSLWSAMLYGKGYLYYAAKSLIKNTVLLPFQIALLGAFFALLFPILKKYRLREEELRLKR